LGIVVGILFTGVGDLTNMPPVNDLNTPVYRRASTDRYLLVCDDPNVVYEVQYAGTSVAAATITANVGLNGQFTTTAGHLLVNDEPVRAVADEEIDHATVTRTVRG
jgi:hypothetical protein